MTQSDLARILGVSFQQVQKYERGRNRLCGSRLQVIANHLGLTVADLYDEPAPAFMPRPLTVREAEEALRIALRLMPMLCVGLLLSRSFWPRLPDHGARGRTPPGRSDEAAARQGAGVVR